MWINLSLLCTPNSLCGVRIVRLRTYWGEMCAGSVIVTAGAGCVNDSVILGSFHLTLQPFFPFFSVLKDGS